MKKIFLILLSALSLAAFAQQQKVAVYVTGEQTNISKILGDQLVAAFAKSGKYAAVERTTSFLAELSKEQSYQRSGAVNDNDIARLGVQFGVNFVCVADMTDAFGEKYISARLIDVETAEVVNTHNVTGEMNSMNACVSMANEIATNLSKGSFAEQAADSKRQQLEDLQRKGFVDLGLPSGTWWKKDNEAGCFSYVDAYNHFGDQLPTEEQCKELIKACTWEWTSDGFVLTSKYNGNKIIFDKRNICCPNSGGSSVHDGLWSKTSYYDANLNTKVAYVLSWSHSDYAGVPNPFDMTLVPTGKYNNETLSFSVRLVMIPNIK